jgi:methylated-DNA-[protein]-cysteine S-methyltransferase
MLRSRTVATPIGTLNAIASNNGLRALILDDDAEFRRVKIDPHDVIPGDSTILDHAVTELAEYFAGERMEFTLPLDPAGTEFQKAVWASLSRIPSGTTSSYTEQAASIGKPSSVRAVASANGRNPLAVIVPCHRVIGADGSLTGFAWGLDAKRWLLRHEGVDI